MDSDAMYARIKDILIDQFDVDADAITMDANLYDELEIDSIDGVDLMVQLKQVTGKKISPEAFRDVRTIRDLLDALQDL
jgi:acyl carrier protein